MTGLLLRSEEADLLFVALRGRSASDVACRLSATEIGGEPQLRNEFSEPSDENHAWYLMGCALEELGHRKCAAKCFRAAFLVCRDDADAYVAYSNTEDDNDQIIRELEHALWVTPDPRVKFNLSDSYMEAGRLRDSKEILQQIPKDWAEYERVRENLALIRAREG